MVSNNTLSNIIVLSWRSVSLVEEIRVPAENHWPVTSQWQTRSHNVVSSRPCKKWGSNWQREWWTALKALVVVNPTTIRSQPRWPHMVNSLSHSNTKINNNISYYSFHHNITEILLKVALNTTTLTPSIDVVILLFPYYCVII